MPRQDLSYADYISAEFPDGPKGWLIDVGANDGLDHTWTVPLERAGWDVLCIEGNPEFAELLPKQRKNTMLAAIDAQDGLEKEFFVNHPKTVSYSGLYQHTGMAGIKAYPVVTRTLTACLDEKGIEDVSIVGLDIEGSEYNALRGFDFDRWQPRLVIVEQHFPTLSEPIGGFMTEQGYEIVGLIGGLDVVYRCA